MVKTISSSSKSDIATVTVVSESYSTVCMTSEVTGARSVRQNRLGKGEGLRRLQEGSTNRHLVLVLLL